MLRRTIESIDPVLLFLSRDFPGKELSARLLPPIVPCSARLFGRYNSGMIQQIARLILVTVLFANQLTVCCAHSHEGESGATPHVHFSRDGDSHAHGHHHSHSHSHHAPAKNNSDQNKSDSNLNQDSLTDQHEDGLIYCMDSNYLTQSKSDNSTDFCQLAILCEPISFVMSTTDRPPHTRLEDARARYCCGIYLQVRSLRL